MIFLGLTGKPVGPFEVTVEVLWEVGNNRKY
jgi:hypothetical protein